jgi:siroheme synthase-like protein
MFPIVLNLADRLCVVVGGGSVGRRKAQAVLDGGGRVRLICREPRDERLANVEWICGDYASQHLEGASLVFAAATPEVNERVAADARARGLWVNRADEPDEADFILPAVLRRGELNIAVSTTGASPLLAQAIRDRLEVQFDEAFATWTTLLAEFRAQVLTREPDASRRHGLFGRLCDWRWLERLRTEDVQTVRAAMQAELDALYAEASQRL